MNELRNTKLNYPIEISEEGVLLQAGTYICVKMLGANNIDLELYLYDVKKQDLISRVLAIGLSER